MTMPAYAHDTIVRELLAAASSPEAAP